MAEVVAIDGKPVGMPGLGSDANLMISPEVAAVLDKCEGFLIKQRISLWEAVTGGCIEQSNVYDIYDSKSGQQIMVGVENSEDCNRCFCAPYHSFFLEFKATVGADYEPAGEIQTKPDGRLIPGVQTQWTMNKDEFAGKETAFTLEREGCCSKPCLGCWICSASCSDGMYLHAGQVDMETGKPGQIKDASGKVMGYAYQPVPWGGCCTPTLNILDANAGEGYRPLAKVEGPCIFGGCSEMCIPSKFLISSIQDPSQMKTSIKTGDLAEFIKQVPKDCGSALRELATDSDNYIMEFHTGITAQQKAIMLASLIQFDYMFFEKDVGMISCEDNKLKITCFECFCAGCVCPCTCTLGGNDGGDVDVGAPPSAEEGMER